MREVQPGAIDAFCDQLLQHFRISGGGTDGDDDLGFSHGDCLTATGGKDYQAFGPNLALEPGPCSTRRPSYLLAI